MNLVMDLESSYESSRSFKQNAIVIDHDSNQ